MAHDFNNMLSVIAINAEMATSALAKIESVNPSLPEYIDDIRRAAERATGLTRQMLIFARQHELKSAAIDLDQPISGLYKMLRQFIGEGIAFVVPTASEEIVVRVDPCQFEQVLMNLAINGSDAMPDGGNFTIRNRFGNFRREVEKPPREIATGRVCHPGGIRHRRWYKP